MFSSIILYISSCIDQMLIVRQYFSLFKLQITDSINQMSNNQILRRQQMNNLIEQDEIQTYPILGVYESQVRDEIKNQEKIKKTPLDYPCCNSYTSPDLDTIRDAKKELGKQFPEKILKQKMNQMDGLDGLYEYHKSNQEFTDQMLRQKIRFARDARQQFFQENGDYIFQKQFFSEELSKKANISFEENTAIHIFQKNAILCERNNQKKLTPFQIQLSIGGIWLNKHPLNNKQQQKFEQIRTNLKEFSEKSSYPILQETSKELEQLEYQRQKSKKDKYIDIEEVQQKIKISLEKYNKERQKIKKIMEKILKGNKQLKEIRRQTGMQTVPWRILIKQFQKQNKTDYDIGVQSFDVPQKVVARNVPDAKDEQERRINIKEEEYFVKIYLNDNMIGKSTKQKLQWPSYKLSINQKFSVLVFSAPSSLKMEIIKTGFINTIVDTIYLTVPGINARSLTSSQKRYAKAYFSSNGKQFREQIKPKKQQSKIETKAPSGVVLYRIQWKGQGSKMPPIGAKTIEEETACTEETQADEQIQEKQIIFDVKDPRVPHLKLKQKVENAIAKGGNSLLPFVDIQSARILLLKLKSTLPQVEKVLIPLTEEELRQRQDLLQIIENQKEKKFQAMDKVNDEVYNPLQDIFTTQPEIVLHEIRQILNKIKTLKSIYSGGTSGVRYKITEQIISEYIFLVQENPIFQKLKELFTQKRKLGPSSEVKSEAKSKIDELQINLHVRSAKNVPIRESSFERIKHFQEEQNKLKHQNMMMQNNNNNPNGFNNQNQGYGQSFNNPQFNTNFQTNLHGNNFATLQADHMNLDRVSGLMELRFKKSVRRTQCFEGPFPEWNQTLAFNFNMKNQSSSLDKIHSSYEKPIKLFVYDIQSETKPTNVIAEARVKKTKYYLGKLEIPFSFIVAVPSISGLYKIQRPLILFSYGVKRAGLFDYDAENQQGKAENPDIHTYVNLDLFSEPIIDSLVAYNSDKKYITSSQENSLLLQNAGDWLEQLNTKRYVRLWLNNIEGKSIFICRYLSDNIEPPKFVDEESGSLIQRSARFVSFIPHRFRCKILENTQQFHMKCDEFLNVKMGEDHGILLCNYFNYIDRVEGRRDFESSLIIGKAFPYGKCIFVLRRNKENNNSEIWDPFKGECYYMPGKEYESFCCFVTYEKVDVSQKTRDICPMIEISCIVSKTNVYFNIQESVKSENIDFNLNDEKKWKPFVTERNRNQLFDKGNIISIQKNIMPDFYPDLQKLQSNLETNLAHNIREKLQNQRKSLFKPYTFKINARITNLVSTKLLPQCESFKSDFRTTGMQSKLYNERSQRNYETAVLRLQQERQKIKNQIPHQKNLYGFTLNMTYTTKNDILEKILETQVHIDENEDLQFVLSVRCFEYPCHLVSVWVFIGSIG